MEGRKLWTYTVLTRIKYNSVVLEESLPSKMYWFSPTFPMSWLPHQNFHLTCPINTESSLCMNCMSATLTYTSYTCSEGKCMHFYGSQLFKSWRIILIVVLLSFRSFTAFWIGFDLGYGFGLFPVCLFVVFCWVWGFSSLPKLARLEKK